MNFMGLRRWARTTILAAFVAVLAAGCASIGAGSRPPEEVVLERAQARWNALIARDWKAAYPYLTPGYRAVVPLQRYGNQFSGPVQWESAKAKSAQCEERRCTVKVEIAFRMVLPGHMDRLTTTHLDETWVFEDGQWYKYETL